MKNFVMAGSFISDKMLKLTWTVDQLIILLLVLMLNVQEVGGGEPAHLFGSIWKILPCCVRVVALAGLRNNADEPWIQEEVSAK
jgi:hypothetical protein